MVDACIEATAGRRLAAALASIPSQAGCCLAPAPCEADCGSDGTASRHERHVGANLARLPVPGPDPGSSVHRRMIVRACRQTRSADRVGATGRACPGPDPGSPVPGPDPGSPVLGRSPASRLLPLQLPQCPQARPDQRADKAPLRLRRRGGVPVRHRVPVAPRRARTPGAAMQAAAPAPFRRMVPARPAAARALDLTGAARGRPAGRPFMRWFLNGDWLRREAEVPVPIPCR